MTGNSGRLSRTQTSEEPDHRIPTLRKGKPTLTHEVAVGRTRRRRRERRILGASMVLSIFFHAVVLNTQVDAPAETLPMGSNRGSPSSTMLEVLRLRAPPDNAPSIPAVTPVEPADDVQQFEEPDPATDVRAAPGSFRRHDPFDPGDSDARLWINVADPEVPAWSTLSAEAVSDSAVHEWNGSGLRAGPFRLGLKGCDSFLTCKLDFVQGSELGDRFSRMREIEDRAALSTLYRARTKAMKLIRSRKRRN